MTGKPSAELLPKEPLTSVPKTRPIRLPTVELRCLNRTDCNRAVLGLQHVRFGDKGE
jgi:hypothetical protein